MAEHDSASGRARIVGQAIHRMFTEPAASAAPRPSRNQPVVLVFVSTSLGSTARARSGSTA